MATIESKPAPRAVRSAGAEAPPGVSESFDQLFERFYRPVYFFFANRGFSPEESRDLTQETFLGVYKGMKRFRQDASIETWLFKIAANIWRNELRSRSAEKRDAHEVSLGAIVDGDQQNPAEVRATADADAPDPLDEALADERVHMLRRGIDDLPPQMRRCLLLRLDQDMKYREIAAVLQVSIETVKSQLFQARERLKTTLAEHFPELDAAGVPKPALTRSR